MTRPTADDSPHAPDGASAPWDPVLECRGIELDCRPGAPPLVMGVLNVTPDSFYDGGRYDAAEAAVARAAEMVKEGAAVIDVGGASSRPAGRTYGAGAEALDPEAEWARIGEIVPAIVAGHPGIAVSVDAYHPTVVERALGAGAHIVNDITGLRLYPDTARLAAEAGAAMVLMHSVGRPGEMPHEIVYDDVTGAVTSSLSRSIAVAREAGVRAVLTDPGFGFGKTSTENLTLLGTLGTLRALGPPVLVGVSRKATVGEVAGPPGAPLPAAERLYGSLGLAAAARRHGASVFRVHDVAATVQMLRAFDAVLKATPDHGSGRQPSPPDPVSID